MKFILVIGENEKHLLEYESDTMAGSLRIRVDNKEVKASTRRLFRPRKESHVLDIGMSERLDVKIETERGLLRGEKNRVFVNGRLVKLFDESVKETTPVVTEQAA